MKRYLPLLLLLNSWQKPVIAVPVVPNFSSGSMSAVTRTTQNITENIVSTDYNIEGYPDKRFVKIIEEIRPEQVTLVPDAPDVITSNRGWKR